MKTKLSCWLLDFFGLGAGHFCGKVKCPDCYYYRHSLMGQHICMENSYKIHMENDAVESEWVTFEKCYDKNFDGKCTNFVPNSNQ